MSSQKDESRSYLGAIKIKESFTKELSPDDFLIEKLSATRLRVLAHKEKLEGLLESILDPTLNEEVSHTLQEIRNYLLVVAGLLELEHSNAKVWEALVFLLTPKMPEKMPPLSDEREAKKIIARLVGFSHLAGEKLEACLVRCEETRENKPPPPPPKSGRSGGLGGLLKKFGF